MACAHPIPAVKSAAGVSLNRFDVEGRVAGQRLLLPCGSCVGCQLSKGRDWSVRCALELQSHAAACWATLTYDDDHVPPTLSKREFSAFFKRLRASLPERIRFFGCGEYGERTFRPHYHAILFGLPYDSRSQSKVQSAWDRGFTRIDRISPAAIAYVAGYCAKKTGFQEPPGYKVDARTGEYYKFQPPFLQMSRGGKSGKGIGGEARDKYWRSWRDSAILDGNEVPVPRYLHQGFEKFSTPEQWAAFEDEQSSRSPLEYERRVASAVIAEARLSLRQEKRKL